MISFLRELYFAKVGVPTRVSVDFSARQVYHIINRRENQVKKSAMGQKRESVAPNKTKKEKVYRAIRPGILYQVLYSTGAFQVDERVQLQQNKRHGHSKKGRRGEGDVLQVF